MCWNELVMIILKPPLLGKKTRRFERPVSAGDRGCLCVCAFSVTVCTAVWDLPDHVLIFLLKFVWTPKERQCHYVTFFHCWNKTTRLSMLMYFWNWNKLFVFYFFVIYYLCNVKIYNFISKLFVFISQWTLLLKNIFE